jgi:ornithine cyclodeaminase/alanine dehydrogenase-like protein (mu-crystallin family)
MTTVYSRAQIAQVIRPKEVIAAMERAFAAYSNGEAVIPPVGQLDFEDPPLGIYGQHIYVNSKERVVIVVWSAQPKPTGKEVVADQDFFAAATAALR